MVTAKENKSNAPQGTSTRDRSSLVLKKTNPFHIDHVLCICIEACNRPEEAGQVSCPVLPYPIPWPPTASG